MNEKNITATGDGINNSGHTIRIELSVNDECVITDIKASASDSVKESALIVERDIKGKSVDFCLTYKCDNEITEQALKNAIGDYYTKVGIFQEEKHSCCCCEEK